MGWIQCRSDPIFSLADGRQVKVVVHVDAATTAVTSLRFALHGPRDSALERILYVGPERVPESAEYHADQPAGRFVAVVIVEAEVDAAVTVEAQLRSAKATGEGRTHEPVRADLIE
ncbi:MAG: hypothetical protein R3B09_18310 [Nannocystaceae bacterium]